MCARDWPGAAWRRGLALAPRAQSFVCQGLVIRKHNYCFVANFAKNVNWPDDHFNGNFIIGVYGDQDLFNQLNKSYTDKLIGSQKIKVKFKKV